jgi:hypothetical protein
LSCSLITSYPVTISYYIRLWPICSQESMLHVQITSISIYIVMVSTGSTPRINATDRLDTIWTYCRILLAIDSHAESLHSIHLLPSKSAAPRPSTVLSLFKVSTSGGTTDFFTTVHNPSLIPRALEHDLRLPARLSLIGSPQIRLSSALTAKYLVCFPTQAQVASTNMLLRRSCA